MLENKKNMITIQVNVKYIPTRHSKIKEGNLSHVSVVCEGIKMQKEENFNVFRLLDVHTNPIHLLQGGFLI